MLRLSRVPGVLLATVRNIVAFLLEEGVQLRPYRDPDVIRQSMTFDLDSIACALKYSRLNNIARFQLDGVPHLQETVLQHVKSHDTRGHHCTGASPEGKSVPR